MISIIADHIISPLGTTTEENFLAVVEGRSMLQRHEGIWVLPDPFVASLFTEKQWEQFSIAAEGYTRFERLAIACIDKVVEKAGIDIASGRVAIVFSSTKGDIELLPQVKPLGESAARIAEYFHAANHPYVVSNACISGLAAQIMAKRLLQSGAYDYAVVCGVEVQSKFIVSGFQSLKAMSAAECRPFDIDRNGLNVGEAAAAMVMKREEGQPEAETWYALDGVIRNDAFHISSPSRTAEGAYNALASVLRTAEEVVGGGIPQRLALVNVHGTSTLYNDEMESVAISRAGLSEVPINTFKGHYGHTMGAAGLLEVILSMRSIDRHMVVGTRGFQEMGVSRKVNISADNRTTDKNMFIKLISGFGGCDAAMLFAKGKETIVKQA